MRVNKLMTVAPTTCGPNDSCSEAARIMWDCDCGSVPVIDSAGRAIGIITDRDICMAALFHGSPLSSITVGEVMSADLSTCQADDDVSDAERLMRERRVRRLPVVDAGGSLVGILSLGDVAQSAGMTNGRGTSDPGDLVETIATISEPRIERRPRLS